MKRKYEGVCIKVYLNPKLYAEMATLAEKSGNRRVGLPLYTQKKHGFADEKLANTDGIARFLKMTAEYWKEHQQELDKIEKEVKERKAWLKNYGRDV